MEVISGYPTTEKTALRYGGFWNRFLAIVIDALILGAVQGILLRPVFGVPMWSYREFDDSGIALSMWEGPNLTVQLLSIVIGWLDFTLMESSNKQATVGKIALNMRVTDLAGNRISFARATGRYFGKYLSMMIFMIGFLMAAFTSKKQALHDVLADTLVVKE
jgi:uncharacterized RDD family membrane protein YckC